MYGKTLLTAIILILCGLAYLYLMKRLSQQRKVRIARVNKALKRANEAAREKKDSEPPH